MIDFEKHLHTKYVDLYAKNITERKGSLSSLLFNAQYLERQFRSAIWDVLEEIGVVHPKDNDDHYRLSSIEYDDYDNSLELMDCEEGFFLTEAQSKILYDEMGFSIVFVNYKDGPHLYGNHTAACNAMPVIKESA